MPDTGFTVFKELKDNMEDFDKEIDSKKPLHKGMISRSTQIFEEFGNGKMSEIERD